MIVYLGSLRRVGCCAGLWRGVLLSAWPWRVLDARSLGCFKDIAHPTRQQHSHNYLFPLKLCVLEALVNLQQSRSSICTFTALLRSTTPRRATARRTLAFAQRRARYPSEAVATLPMPTENSFPRGSSSVVLSMLAYASGAIFVQYSRVANSTTEPQTRAIELVSPRANVREGPNHLILHGLCQYAGTAAENAGPSPPTHPPLLSCSACHRWITKRIPLHDLECRRQHGDQRQQRVRMRVLRHNLKASHKELSTELPDLDA